MAIETNEAGCPEITLDNMGSATRHELLKFCRFAGIALKRDKSKPTLQDAVAEYLRRAPQDPKVALRSAELDIDRLQAEIRELQEKLAAKNAKATVSAQMIERARRTLALAISDDPDAGSVTLTPEEILAGGWSDAYAHLSNGWGRTKPAGLAFRELGWVVAGRQVLVGESIPTRNGDRVPHTITLVRAALCGLKD